MEDDLAQAMAFARAHAETGLRAYPFDAVYKAALHQLDLVTACLDDDGTLASLPPGSIALGIMAAKELGNDERDFAHALHVVQCHADAAMGRRDRALRPSTGDPVASSRRSAGYTYSREVANVIEPRDDTSRFAAGTDWPTFVADLDPDLVRRFDHVICELPPVISLGAVIDRVDALIARADAAWGRNGYPGWNAYVADVRELAVLRERLREWFFERGYRDDARVAAHLGSLMLDSRTSFVGAPVADAGIQPPPLAGRVEAIVAAAPYLILIVVMLATLCLVMMMTFEDIIGWRNAAAGIMLAMAVTMLSMGAIVGTVRQRRRPAPPPPDVTPPPQVPYAAHGILVTRDSVCMADDVDAPHAARIAIDPAADALGVADAILAAGYLPAVAGTSTWSISLGDAPDADAAVFGHYSGGSFRHRVDGGTATLRSTGVARIALRYHGQQRPDDVIGQLALTRRDAMDDAGRTA